MIWVLFIIPTFYSCFMLFLIALQKLQIVLITFTWTRALLWAFFTIHLSVWCEPWLCPRVHMLITCQPLLCAQFVDCCEAPCRRLVSFFFLFIFCQSPLTLQCSCMIVLLEVIWVEYELSTTSEYRGPLFDPTDSCFTLIDSSDPGNPCGLVCMHDQH